MVLNSIVTTMTGVNLQRVIDLRDKLFPSPFTSIALFNLIELVVISTAEESTNDYDSINQGDAAVTYRK